ncbi:KilA-N domain-containing protein [Salmonella enterica subsp. enterica]|nr:KilA-N domain-containing protein [Salmonella enterica subsp. enterica]
MSRLAKSDAVKVLPKEPKGLASGTPAFEHDIKALIINGDTVDIRVDKEGRVNLNDIRQASPLAGTRKKEISQWLGAAKTKKLINSLQSTTQICVVKSEEGGNHSGTYVHPDIALAYAAAVDNDFYVNVAKTFGNVVRGDIDAAIEEGRANMNDIHAASGGKASKRPNQFLRIKKAKLLISQVEESSAQKCAVVTHEGGDHSGTWAHIDVLLAYAAWIDAEFESKVGIPALLVRRGRCRKT